MEASFRPVVELAAVMDEFDRPWFISGGWAIDLFVGRATRDHDDIEFGVFFPDQAAIRRHLADWALYRPDSGQWLPLAADDEVRLPAHQIQARSATRPPFQLDVFLNPRVGDDWLSRRHARLRVPATEVATHSLGAAGEPAGIPFLVPEIQLLYKAKAHRPKDDADFAVALPHLDARRRAWLRMGLEAFHPDDPWLAALADHDRA